MLDFESASLPVWIDQKVVSATPECNVLIPACLFPAQAPLNERTVKRVMEDVRALSQYISPHIL